MNRVIKFRSWDKKLNEMVVLTTNFKALFLNDALKELQDTFELMQYTGLKDKNGKEIYEGDVYRRLTWELDGQNNSSDIWQEPEVVGNIKEFFEEKGYGEGELMQSYEPQNLEVIGNIYENPELLK